MMNFRKTVLTIAALTVTLSLAGCVSSLSSRNATQGYQDYQQPIPQGVGPMEPPPAVEPAPEPLPPTPSAARSLGIRTTSFIQSIGDKMRLH